MDSTFTFVHWEKSHLPIVADLWIGDPKTEEPLQIPEQFDIDFNIEPLSNTKETEKDSKTEWKPNPMEI